MTGLPNAAVNRVRVRLALDELLGVLRSRGVDNDQLLAVVEHVVDDLGSFELQLVAERVDHLFWAWKRDPRQTLLEYVKDAR